MNKIIFDCSSHLGQFCTDNESVRIGCKNVQASISPVDDFGTIGAWTDLENGRADRSIWNLPTEAQDDYYPVMDRFYSIMNVAQDPITNIEEDISARLRAALPELSLYSRYTCARAITMQANEIQTLVKELLDDTVLNYMQESYGITVVKPAADVEESYSDSVLEARYQTALETFKKCNINIPNALADSRDLDV